MKDNKENKNKSDSITYSVPFSIDKLKGNIVITSEKNEKKLSKEEIISKAFLFHKKGNINKAEKYYKYFLDLGYRDPIVFSNYGAI